MVATVFLAIVVGVTVTVHAVIEVACERASASRL